MHTKSQKTAQRVGRIITYIILILRQSSACSHFYGWYPTSFKETSEIYKMPPDLSPTNPTVQNYIEGGRAQILDCL